MTSMKGTNDVVIVGEWDADTFHRRVLELEAQGYVARLETYDVTPEMNPSTGEITHLHTIELRKPEANQKQFGPDPAASSGLIR